jgi:hypothetical protein
MVLVPLVAAPSLMLAVSAAERRFGPAVAGAMAAMPVALSIIVLAVGAELGRDAGATLAAAAVAHVVAQVAFALAFATVITRHGGPLGLLAGVTAFALVSLLVEPVPPALAITAAIPTLFIKGPFIKGSDPLTTRSHENPCSERNRSIKGSDPLMTALGAGAALGMVATALVTAEVAGPAAAGAIGAFPALSTAFALVLVRTHGAGAAANALRGLVGGLRAYLVFCVTVAVAAPMLGVFTAVPVGLGLCLATYVVLLRPARSRPAAIEASCS